MSKSKKPDIGKRLKSIMGTIPLGNPLGIEFRLRVLLVTFENTGTVQIIGVDVMSKKGHPLPVLERNGFTIESIKEFVKNEWPWVSSKLKIPGRKLPEPSCLSHYPEGALILQYSFRPWAS